MNNHYYYYNRLDNEGLKYFNLMNLLIPAAIDLRGTSLEGDILNIFRVNDANYPRGLKARMNSLMPKKQLEVAVFLGGTARKVADALQALALTNQCLPCDTLNALTIRGLVAQVAKEECALNTQPFWNERLRENKTLIELYRRAYSLSEEEQGEE